MTAGGQTCADCWTKADAQLTINERAANLGDKGVLIDVRLHEVVRAPLDGLACILGLVGGLIPLLVSMRTTQSVMQYWCMLHAPSSGGQCNVCSSVSKCATDMICTIHLVVLWSLHTLGNASRPQDSSAVVVAIG